MSNQHNERTKEFLHENAIAHLGEHFNRINDWDVTWIGFHRLKPAPGDFMSVRTVAELSLWYAPALAICVVVTGLVATWPNELIALTSTVAAASFVLLQSLSALFWNRRADRLRISRCMALRFVSQKPSNNSRWATEHRTAWPIH